MKLAHGLNFAKKIKLQANSPKTKATKGIKQAVKEVNLVKAGILKARDAKDLINEL